MITKGMSFALLCFRRFSIFWVSMWRAALHRNGYFVQVFCLFLKQMLVEAFVLVTRVLQAVFLSELNVRGRCCSRHGPWLGLAGQSNWREHLAFAFQYLDLPGANGVLTPQNTHFGCGSV